MPHHKPGKVVVLFGNFPLTIRLPAAPRDEQLRFLRDRIIFHTDNLVEYGLWDEPLSDSELDNVMSDVEIEPIFLPDLNTVLSWLGYPFRILKEILNQHQTVTSGKAPSSLQQSRTQTITER